MSPNRPDSSFIPHPSSFRSQEVLARRMGRAEGDRRKPVERGLEDFIDLFGLPVEREKVAQLTALQYGRDTDYFLGMLERIVPTWPQFFVAPGGGVGITRWLL